VPYSTAEHFAKNHGGFDGLIKFIEICNKEKDLHRIASSFKMSASQACRLRNGLLEQVWKPRRGVTEFIEFKIHCMERDVNMKRAEVREKVEKNIDLKLIPGKV
jgi:hypothetical protein